MGKAARAGRAAALLAAGLLGAALGGCEDKKPAGAGGAPATAPAKAKASGCTTPAKASPGKSPSAAAGSPSAAPAPRPALDTAGRVDLRSRVPAGLKAVFRETGLVKVNSVLDCPGLLGQPGTKMPMPFKISWKRKFADEVKAVREGRLQVIERKMEIDLVEMYSEQAKRDEPRDLPAKDLTLTLTIKDDGAITLGEDADAQAVEEFRGQRGGRIVPEASLKEGEECAVDAGRLRAAIPSVTDGRGRLKMTGLALKPALGRWAARLEGDFELVFRIVNGEDVTILDFRGKVTVEVVPDLGLEVLRAISGKVVMREKSIPTNATISKLTGQGELRTTLVAESLKTP